jgi:hypothetical protein
LQHYRAHIGLAPDLSQRPLMPHPAAAVDHSAGIDFGDLAFGYCKKNL